MVAVQNIGRTYRISVIVEKYEKSGVVDGVVIATISSLKAKLTGIASPGKHIRFIILVTCNGSSWRVSKRFSDFVSFHQSLCKYHPYLPELPAGSVRRDFTTSFLDNRQKFLGIYLNRLCKNRDVLNNVLFQEFFALRDHVVDFLKPCSKEPVQVAELHEGSYGIKDFAYDAEQGLLLVGATNSNLGLRIEVHLNNLRLPWEVAKDKLPLSKMTLWKQCRKELHFEPLLCCKYTQDITCVALSTAVNIGLCVCGLSDGSVGYHTLQAEDNTSCGTTLPLLKHTSPVIALAFDDAQGWVISVSSDGAVIIYNLKCRRIYCYKSISEAATTVHYCQSAKLLFTGCASGRLVVWTTSTFPISRVAVISYPSISEISAIDYYQDTATIIIGSKSGLTLWLLDQSAGISSGRMMCHVSAYRMMGAPTSLVYSSSSQEVLASFSNGTVCSFDIESTDLAYVLVAHSDNVTKLAWLDNTCRLVTASQDKRLKIWNFPSLERQGIRGDGLLSNSLSSLSKLEQNSKSPLTLYSIAAEDSDDDDLAGWDAQSSEDSF